MEHEKRYNVQGFTALSGLLEHVNVLEETAMPGAPAAPASKPGSSEVHSLLLDIQSKLGRVVELLGGGRVAHLDHRLDTAKKPSRSIYTPSSGVPVDGVYDGQGNMVADDGTRYRIPSGYVAKAYLQEGDLMQVTVDAGGMKKFKKIYS